MELDHKGKNIGDILLEMINNSKAQNRFTSRNELVEYYIPRLEALGLLKKGCVYAGPECMLAKKVIHVAGTKGKGSTCAFLDSILRVAGYRTGLFTSPHLVKPNERIRINGIPVDDITLKVSV